MNGLSVVIPSRTASNLSRCIEHVLMHEPSATQIIVVDDGVEWDDDSICDLARTFAVIGGQRPFVFARNVNIGIRAAGQDDVIVLNDDALLQTPEGFTRLQKAAQAHPGFGIIAAACNNVGNPNQFACLTLPGILNNDPREEPRMVCFVAVLIPRRTIEAVGLLDERYVGYGMDDDDYCLRVRQAGLKIGIHDGCYVDHGSLTSTFRGAAGAGGNFLPNMRLFIEKWGTDNWGQGRATSQFRELFPA